MSNNPPNEKERAVVKISMPIGKVLPFVIGRIRDKTAAVSAMANNFMQDNREREVEFVTVPLGNLAPDTLSTYSSEIGSLIEILEDAVYELTENRNVLDGLGRSLVGGSDQKG